MLYYKHTASREMFFLSLIGYNKCCVECPVNTDSANKILYFAVLLFKIMN